MSSQSFQRNMVFSDFMIADHEALHALEMFELGWWASKDRQNNVTIMVPNEHREKMESLGCEISPLAVASKPSFDMSVNR